MPKSISFTEFADKSGKGKFTPRPLTRTDRAFKQMFREILDLRVPRKQWRFTVRPSSMPFCQWQAMLAQLYGADAPTDQEDYARDFYMAVGHVAHEVTQRWLGRAGYLFGPYECKHCKSVEVSQGTPEMCPSGCPDPQWIYREINLKHADTSNEFASAHADGLIRFEWMPEHHYYLVDFKTCSLHTLPKPEYGLTSEWHQKYVYQTAIYAHLLSRADDIEIDGTAFIFIPRDDPKQLSAVLIDQSETHAEIYHNAIKDARTAKIAAQTGETVGIRRDCKTHLDKPECPFNSACFDRDRTMNAFKKKIGKLPILPDF